MNSKVDYLFPDEEYKPKLPDWEKVQHYVNVDGTGCELHAHERDVYTPAPEIMTPPPPR